MNAVGKILILTGIIIFLLGVILSVFFQVKVPYIGKLPGDITIEKKNFTFYFPLTTCLLISLILSAVLYFFSRK